MSRYIDADRIRRGVTDNMLEAEYLENHNDKTIVAHFRGQALAYATVLDGLDKLEREQPESRIMTREMIEGRLLQNDTESWNEDYNEEDLQTRFAFYIYKDNPSKLYLSNVFVEEASRNHGFGTKILKAAEKVAETIGATIVCLKVKQDSPANAWYRKNGYSYVTFEGEYDWLEKNLE